MMDLAFLTIMVLAMLIPCFRYFVPRKMDNRALMRNYFLRRRLFDKHLAGLGEIDDSI